MINMLTRNMRSAGATRAAIAFTAAATSTGLPSISASTDDADADAADSGS